MKIFVTIGTQTPFERLVDWVKSCIESSDELEVQDLGRLLPEGELEEKIRWADVVVAHAGIGTLIKVRKMGKPLVMVPRLASFGEQRNDHQRETCGFVRERGLALVAENCDELKHLLDCIRCGSVSVPMVSSADSRTLMLSYPGEKVLGICSFGGHWVELRAALAGADVMWASTGGTAVYKVEDFSRKDFWKALKVVWQIWRLLCQVKPDVVVSTGAAPGSIAIVVGKLLGIRTVWIDSIATTSRLSLSGRLALPFCKEVYAQWPELAKGRIKYNGNVLGL